MSVDTHALRWQRDYTTITSVSKRKPLKFLSRFKESLDTTKNYVSCIALVA
jgi:hypothetical protein